MARLFVRVDFEPSGSALGPGMVELLEYISEKGSIRQSAAARDMSYRKAWLLLRSMHQTFGAPVVVTTTGVEQAAGTLIGARNETGSRLPRHGEKHLSRRGERDACAFGPGAEKCGYAKEAKSLTYFASTRMRFLVENSAPTHFTRTIRSVLFAPLKANRVGYRSAFGATILYLGNPFREGWRAR